jgi:peptidoglycan/LPS O-acetylase OafA/YrhL
MSDMNNARLHQVDVWRFIAIGLVLGSHLIAYSHPWYATVADGLVWRVEILGLIGVKIFFCISGYVICRGMVREWDSTGRLDMRAFYRRRIFRILPPLFVYIGVVALLNAAGVFDLAAAPFFQSAAFLCNTKNSFIWCFPCCFRFCCWPSIGAASGCFASRWPASA